MESLSCLTSESIKLLQKNALLKALIKAQLTRDTLSNVIIENDEAEKLIEEFSQKFGIKNPESKDKWLKTNNLTNKDLEYLALFQTKINRYSKNNFAEKVEAHFLKRKTALDIVVYSLIRTSDPFLIKELYMRVKENETDFGSLASKYSEGLEKKTRGIIGPVNMQNSHPQLNNLLKTAKPGEVNQPLQIQNFHLLVRLESYEPAKLDDFMREKLEQELFQEWLDHSTIEIEKNILLKYKTQEIKGS